MWRSYLARVLVWFVALAGLGLYATAQTNTGNIYGTVVDDQNQGLPGGTVTLTGPQAPRTTTVDEGGRFRFLKVPGGTYKVTVTMPGFTTAKRENVIVTLGKDTRRRGPAEGFLRPGDGDRHGHDAAARHAQGPDRRDLREGRARRDPDLPRHLRPDPAGAGRAARHGQRRGQRQRGSPAGRTSSAKGSGNVIYQVDGSTITDNTYGNPLGRQNGGTNTFFDFSTFEDVEVTTGGSLLELQNPGVTINVVTKRGTNELKGSARFRYAAAQLAIEQRRRRKRSMRTSRPTARECSATTERISAARSSGTSSGCGLPAAIRRSRRRFTGTPASPLPRRWSTSNPGARSSTGRSPPRTP